MALGRKISIALLLVACFFGLSSWLSSKAFAGEIHTQSDALVYVPASRSANEKMPVVFSFSPGGDAAYMVRLWQEMADEQHWIIYASKEYRNHLNMNAMYPQIRQRMTQTLQQYPQADASRIILTGMSGGASFSHAMNLEYPGVASALIVNTGRIWEDVLARHELSRENFGRSKKLLVFLASPTDFRYQEMKQDEQLMKQKGWKTHWIEFQGGHRYAPDAVYQQAVQWIVNQPEWKN